MNCPVISHQHRLTQKETVFAEMVIAVNTCKYPKMVISMLGKWCFTAAFAMKCGSIPNK